MRADAAENRARILATAEALFAERGAAVEMKLVAERAGVGVGTLYRHFATKEALFQALVARRIETFTEEAAVRAPAADASADFFAILARFVDMYIANKHVCDAVAVDVGGLDGVREPFREALAVALRRAQRAGGVRRDVGAADVMTLVCGTFALPAARTPEVRARLQRVLADGLRPPARAIRRARRA
jgi:AcrR family transcriptional regulator